MHFADAHFGIETYGRIDSETGLNTRLVDFRNSLNFAIDKALDAGVKVALFAGDAYKARDPNQTHQREFASCIRRLTDAGIPVVMVTGNHDVPNATARANAVEIYRTLGVKDVHVLSRPEIVRIETLDGPIQIAAMPYLLRSAALSKEATKGKSVEETTELMVGKYSEYIDYLARQLEPGIPSVLLGHFWVMNAKLSAGPGYFNPSEPQMLVSVAANPEFDYVAMGHIHKFQDLNKRAHPPVVYAGSIDRTDFGERNEEKGFVIADVAKGATTYEFVSVPARRFVDIDVDADLDEPTEKILKAISEKDVADAVVRLKYRISRERLPLVREQEVRDALSAAFMVVSVTRDVTRDAQATRNRLLNESLDPVKALEMFLDTKQNLRKRKDTLMEHARPMIDELLAEEQVQ